MRSTFGAVAVFVLAGTLQSIPAAPDPQGAASNDCCSADAQKKSAAAGSFLDIVGIKLGMTPGQAVAAIKAYNPNLKYNLINSRLERPSSPNGFVRVPRFIRAISANYPNHTVGQAETIIIAFTTPPNPPVVEEVERVLYFKVGEPLVSTTVMDGLRKKYGQENFGSPGGPRWVYDANGRLLARVSSPDQASCAPQKDLGSYLVADPTLDAHETINLADTADNTNLGLTPACFGYLYALADGTGTSPNDQVFQIRVQIRSGALVYGSMKATHNWLQSEAGAIQKKSDSGAAQRPAPKL